MYSSWTPFANVEVIFLIIFSYVNQRKICYPQFNIDCRRPNIFVISKMIITYRLSFTLGYPFILEPRPPKAYQWRSPCSFCNSDINAASRKIRYAVSVAAGAVNYCRIYSMRWRNRAISAVL